MTKMSDAVILSFVALTTAICASFASANEGRAVGVGDLACSTFVGLYDGRGSDERKLLMQKVEQWALGYMSGLNERADDSTLRDISYFATSDLGYDILSECRASADSRIFEVVTEIYEYAPMSEMGSV